MNDLGPGRKFIQFSGYPVIKPCAYGNQQITLTHGKVSIGRAVHPQHP